jgi:hypothetical protein
MQTKLAHYNRLSITRVKSERRIIEIIQTKLMLNNILYLTTFIALIFSFNCQPGIFQSGQ